MNQTSPSQPIQQRDAANSAAGDSATELLRLLTGKVNLTTADIATLRNSYKSAQPFPHVVIDNLFLNEVLERVLAEAPRMKKDQWMNVEQEGLEKIVRMRSSVELGPSSSEFTGFLHSAPFLYLLSEITGIWQLLPDPYLQGGGHALMERGGYFKIHVDRNIAYETGLTRRLAMIIFLNKDWHSEYHGQLELWNREGTQCEARVEPLFNKTVIFEIAPTNFHGVPQPLACPPDRMRQSFLLYYHTVGNDAKTAPHTSIFAPGFYRKKKSTLRRLVDNLTPPFVVKVVRRLRRPLPPD